VYGPATCLATAALRSAGSVAPSGERGGVVAHRVAADFSQETRHVGGAPGSPCDMPRSRHSSAGRARRTDVPGREQPVFFPRNSSTVRDEHDPVERDPVAFQPAARTARNGCPVALPIRVLGRGPAAVAAYVLRDELRERFGISSTPRNPSRALPTGLENPVRWDR